MERGLWVDLDVIVNEWLLDHPDLTPADLVEDIYDYVMENFGPPF